MVTKKTLAKSKKTSKSPEQIPIQIRVEVSEETPYLYVNYIEVSHSQYEFCINVLRLPTKLNAGQSDLVKGNKPVPLETEMQLLIPARLIPGLIYALEDQKQKFEKAHGKIEGETNARSKKK